MLNPDTEETPVEEEQDEEPYVEPEDTEWGRMTLSEQREAMGGEFGGDGPDD